MIFAMAKKPDNSARDKELKSALRENLRKRKQMASGLPEGQTQDDGMAARRQPISKKTGPKIRKPE